jgi:Flp pilus assembly protein TadD
LSRPARLSLMAIAALAAVAIVVSGCGGGGSSSGSSAGATSGDEEASGSFASGAESACAKANKAIEALGTPEQSEVLKYLETTESVIGKLSDEVSALNPSNSAEKAYTAALAKSETVLNEMTNAARNENFDAVREISDELIELHLGELAENADLRICAEVPVSEE